MPRYLAFLSLTFFKPLVVKQWRPGIPERQDTKKEISVISTVKCQEKVSRPWSRAKGGGQEQDTGKYWPSPWVERTKPGVQESQGFIDQNMGEERLNREKTGDLECFPQVFSWVLTNIYTSGKWWGRERTTWKDWGNANPSSYRAGNSTCSPQLEWMDILL